MRAVIANKHMDKHGHESNAIIAERGDVESVSAELGSTRSTGSGRQILHVLEPEPAFDAQVPVGDGVVRGAGDVDDRALLHVQLEVAADTAE